jgi:SulP family sulfate permease
VEDPAQRAALPPGVEVFRIAGPMFFGVAGEMLEALTRIGRAPRAVVLRLDRVPYIDSTGIHVLETFVARAAGAHAGGAVRNAAPGVAGAGARRVLRALNR